VRFSGLLGSGLVKCELLPFQRSHYPRPDFPNVIFAFHDNEELGPKMLARIAKQTGLKPEDL
jgi:hypothetical protein